MIATVTVGAGAVASASGEPAVISAVAAGACIMAVLAALLLRRRVVARISRKYEEVLTSGFVTGALAAYRKAVFAGSPDGLLTIEELRGLRTAAYQAAADEDLPHEVRQAAAAVLEAIDARDAPRTEWATTALTGAIENELRAVWRTST